ncbi:TPA: hypothetical protein NK399_003920 [Vibrio parahaemolyticus]|nr:hypothetical protein [Vibrio parahaemolyticus]
MVKLVYTTDSKKVLNQVVTIKIESIIPSIASKSLTKAAFFMSAINHLHTELWYIHGSSTAYQVTSLSQVKQRRYGAETFQL